MVTSSATAESRAVGIAAGAEKLGSVPGDYTRLAIGDEIPVLSWIEWPDRATADAAWAAMMTEDHPDMADMPFDGARMFWGGFAPIVDLR